MGINLNFKNFKSKVNYKKKREILKHVNNIKNFISPEFLKSFKKDYKYSYSRKFIKKYINFNDINIIGMGGSSLGAKAIYSFLKPKIKKKFIFTDNLNSIENHKKTNKYLNIIISKSGNTLETISNYSTIKGKKNNFF